MKKFSMPIHVKFIGDIQSYNPNLIFIDLFRKTGSVVKFAYTYHNLSSVKKFSMLTLLNPYEISKGKTYATYFAILLERLIRDIESNNISFTIFILIISFINNHFCISNWLRAWKVKFNIWKQILRCQTLYQCRVN